MQTLIGLIFLAIVIIALIILGILASVYIITGQHLVKKSLAGISYGLYLIIGLVVSWWTLCFSPANQIGANLRESLLTAVFSLIILAVLCFIFSFVFHRFWESRTNLKNNYSPKFIKTLKTTNLISILLMVIGIIYTIFQASGNEILAFNVLSFIALIITVILGFVNFLIMIKTLRLKWYLSGLILQSLFIIFVMISLTEMNM